MLHSCDKTPIGVVISGRRFLRGVTERSDQRLCHPGCGHTACRPQAAHSSFVDRRQSASSFACHARSLQHPANTRASPPLPHAANRRSAVGPRPLPPDGDSDSWRVSRLMAVRAGRPPAPGGTRTRVSPVRPPSGTTSGTKESGWRLTRSQSEGACGRPVSPGAASTRVRGRPASRSTCPGITGTGARVARGG
jgi:hypothetical protein